MTSDQNKPKPANMLLKFAELIFYVENVEVDDSPFPPAERRRRRRIRAELLSGLREYRAVARAAELN